MWEHLLPDMARIGFDHLDGKQSASKRIKLKNGSTAAVLTQSQRAVRGLRVQKLRCDEVEMFDPAIWEAAQLVTKSKQSMRAPNRSDTRLLKAFGISGAIEAISTLHEVGGLMQKIVESADGKQRPTETFPQPLMTTYTYWICCRFSKRRIRLV